MTWVQLKLEKGSKLLSAFLRSPVLFPLPVSQALLPPTYHFCIIFPRMGLEGGKEGLGMYECYHLSACHVLRIVSRYGFPSITPSRHPCCLMPSAQLRSPPDQYLGHRSHTPGRTVAQ